MANIRRHKRRPLDSWMEDIHSHKSAPHPVQHTPVAHKNHAGASLHPQRIHSDIRTLLRSILSSTLSKPPESPHARILPFFFYNSPKGKKNRAVGGPQWRSYSCHSFLFVDISYIRVMRGDASLTLARKDRGRNSDYLYY